MMVVCTYCDIRIHNGQKAYVCRDKLKCEDCVLKNTELKIPPGEYIKDSTGKVLGLIG